MLTEPPARSSRWSSRSATGAATAGASPARTTPAASASTGSSATCPHGYDHKYTYSHIGYNLKVTDMQAAVGVAQLEKLPGFIEARRAQLRAACATGSPTSSDFFILPEADAGLRPELVRLPARRPRRTRRSTATRVIAHLESAKIAHAAALRRQPARASRPTATSRTALVGDARQHRLRHERTRSGSASTRA